MGSRVNAIGPELKVLALHAYEFVRIAGNFVTAEKSSSPYPSAIASWKMESAAAAVRKGILLAEALPTA
jgi:hypothetical protein